MRPYILGETNWKHVKDADFNVVVLPWGATEAHNYHLPYATDVIQVESIAARSAMIATDAGAKIIVLPTVPFGVNTGQADIKLDLNLNPSTQLIVLSDIVETLNRQNLYKLLILNGHGGNDFKPMIRELGLKFPKMFISSCDWFKFPYAKRFFKNPGDHADEMETSLMLHLKPDLVLPLSEAGPGQAKKNKIRAYSEGWVWAERRWSQVTEDTGIGNPKLATKERGQRLFQFITRRIGDLLIELDKLDLNNIYEYESNDELI